MAIVVFLLVAVLGCVQAQPVQDGIAPSAAGQRHRSAVMAAMQVSIAAQRAAAQVQRQAAVRSLFSPTELNSVVGTPQCEPMPKDQIDPIIDDASTKEGLKSELLRAVIEQESAYRPCAVSPKGARGLMQLMPATARRFGVDDPFEPKQNIAAGAKFLKELLARYNGDISLALGAYNAGPGAVDASGGVPSIGETLQYVQQIVGKLPNP